MKESSEPLVQQYRELSDVISNFIQIKQKNRIVWHEVEPIFLYYKKYLNGRVEKPYDFEGEVLDYLHRNGEPTARIFLQSLRNDMMKIIAYYNRWQEFYRGYSHQDLLNEAVLYYKKRIKDALVIIHKVIDIDLLNEVPYDKNKLPSTNFKSLQNKLQECRRYSLSLISENYHSMMDSIAKVDDFASVLSGVLFDFSFLTFTIQKQVDVINKFIGEPAPGTDFYPVDYFSTDCAREPIIYFSENLMTDLYDLCNGNQFASINMMNFSANFNLQISETSLVVKKKEKQRVYYLLYKLSEVIQEDMRDTWLEAILDNLKLKKEIYNKKCKEAESITQPQKTKEYVSSLKKILTNYKA